MGPLTGAWSKAVVSKHSEGAFLYSARTAPISNLVTTLQTTHHRGKRTSAGQKQQI